MSLPTGGTRTATAYTPNSTWQTSLVLAGDAEKAVGDNASSETDVINRLPKLNSDRTQYLYDTLILQDSNRDGLISLEDISETTSLTRPLYTVLNELEGKTINHDIEITLHTNLSLNSIDHLLNLKNISGAGSITVNLNGKQLTTGAAYGSTKVFNIENCSIKKIRIYNGTIDDDTAQSGANKLFNVFNCDNVSSYLKIDNMINWVTAGKAAEHFYLADCRNVVLNANQCERGNSAVTAYGSNVFSDTQASPSTDPDYGYVLYEGSFLKCKSTQFAGTVQNIDLNEGSVKTDSYGMTSPLTGTATPVGAVVPNYIGQIYVNTTAPDVYISTGLTNSDWVQVD